METNNLDKNEQKDLRPIHILYFPSDTKNGVWYYRTKMPMFSMTNMSNDFNVNISNHIDFGRKDVLDNIVEHCDIFIFHNGIFNAEYQDGFWKALIYLRKNGVKIVMDIDDYWNYGPDHPMVDYCIVNAVPEKTKMNFELVDAITTTTEYFAEKIRKTTKTPVKVLPNGISFRDEQFSEIKNPSNKVRFGLTGGASHINDVKQLLDFPKFLSKGDLDRIELVFCGYDLSGNRISLDENGIKVKEEELPIEDNWWWQTEQHWKKYFDDEHYLRIPTKKIDQKEYGQIYKDIDVLLVPLKPSEFNSCKSELKFIEAGFTNTAIIATNTGPYREYGRDKIDCELVKECNPRAWAGKIHKLLNDKYRKELTENLHNRIVMERSLEFLNIDRMNFYKSLVGRN